MAMPKTIRRFLVTGAATLTAAVLAASPAFAQHCFIPMYNLNGPASPNWWTITAEDGLALEGMPGVKCEAQRKAGYAALRAAKLPVAIKVKVDMTIADPKGEGRMAPNGANGKGLEYFGAGSDLPERMLTTFSAGASSVRC